MNMVEPKKQINTNDCGLTYFPNIKELNLSGEKVYEREVT